MLKDQLLLLFLLVIVMGYTQDTNSLNIFENSKKLLFIDCPPDGIDEGEGACPDEYIDNYNGGCQSEPVIFLPIESQDIYCGILNTYTVDGFSMRDSDWYRLDLSDQSNEFFISVDIICEMPYQVFIINALEEDCIDYEILSYNSGGPNETINLFAFGESGVYWLAVMGSVFEGFPDAQDYVMECVVSKFTLPANDICENAIPINVVSDYEFSTVGATTDGFLNSCGGIESCNDIWFSFMPTFESDVLFSLCGSSFDTRLALWEDCGITELACNDDVCGQQSELTYPVICGYTYLIQLGGHDSEVGEGILNIIPVYYPYPLSGQLTYFGNETPMSEVLISAGTDSALTNENGYFSNINVPEGNLILNCFHNKVWQSPDILDALIILHYLAAGIPEMSEIQMMAADVSDGSGESVNVIDALSIRQFLATGSFPSQWQSPNWLYFETHINVSGPSEIDFQALMAGDVNGSNIPLP